MTVKHLLRITGMHCRGCKTLIEGELGALQGVKSIQVDHADGKASVEFDDSLITADKIIKTINGLNYGATTVEAGEKIIKPPKKRRWFAAAFFIFIISGYGLITYFNGFDILSALYEEQVAFPVIFLIGIIAGFHCIGMCGGLVVAYSTAARSSIYSQPIMPHFQYNLGRMISYTLIGAILGGIGSFFGINPYFSGALLVFSGFFMFMLGLSYLTNFAIFKKLKISTPAFVGKLIYQNKNKTNPKGPFYIGLLNGFMPCGPLQAMQILALGTGSAFFGALAMGTYALGTVIVMLAFGVAISSIRSSNLNRMLKLSGALVIVLGLAMAGRGLVNFGAPDTGAALADKPEMPAASQEFQTVNMDLTYRGYVPNTLRIKAGVPVRWVIDVKQMTGCTDAIMIESLGIKKDLQYGENIIEFTPPPDAKEIKFSCWMRMVWGKFVVE